MPDGVLVATLLGVLLTNALFVMAEFSLVGAPRAAIERRAADGERLAVLVFRVLDNPALRARYLATAQLGVTCASLGLGMWGEHALSVRFEQLLGGYPALAHALGGVLAVGLLTGLHLVAAEVVPKSYCLTNAEGVVLRLAPLMRVLMVPAAPLVGLVNAVCRGLLRALGVRPADSAAGHSSDELEEVVRESREGGLLEPQAGAVLAELFDFGDLTAGEVMTPRTRIAGLPLGAGADEVRAVLRSDPFSRYPVYDGDLDEIRGVLHVKRLTGVLLHGRRLELADLRVVPFVPETARLDTVLEKMRAAGTQMAIVMDEFGGTAGLVSTDDLAAEIVGELAAGTSGPAQLRPQPDGRVLAGGTARLADLGELLEVELAHDEVDTVSGLVLMQLDRPPRVGDRLEYRGLSLLVTAVEGLGVGECAVSRCVPDSAA